MITRAQAVWSRALLWENLQWLVLTNIETVASVTTGLREGNHRSPGSPNVTYYAKPTAGGKVGKFAGREERNQEIDPFRFSTCFSFFHSELLEIITYSKIQLFKKVLLAYR